MSVAVKERGDWRQSLTTGSRTRSPPSSRWRNMVGHVQACVLRLKVLAAVVCQLRFHGVLCFSASCFQCYLDAQEDLPQTGWQWTGSGDLGQVRLTLLNTHTFSCIILFKWTLTHTPIQIDLQLYALYSLHLLRKKEYNINLFTVYIYNVNLLNGQKFYEETVHLVIKHIFKEKQHFQTLNMVLKRSGVFLVRICNGTFVVTQVPVWGAGPGDGLCGVRSTDWPRDDKVAFSEAGVKCKHAWLTSCMHLFCITPLLGGKSIALSEKCRAFSTS